MAKINKQGPQKKGPGTNTSRTDEMKKPDIGTVKSVSSSASKDITAKNRQSGKNSRPGIGGTAVQGAKSTQPKEMTATNPQQQQAESYNRTMRRRMEHMGTGQSSTSTVQDQRQKRLEKRKKRLEERRQEVKKVTAGAPRNITLGRRNTYFLIAVAALIVIIIAVAIILHNVR